MQIKHSVIIITYNQEKLISRAIDSLLSQKDLIYEIIIADDCSTDNNWNIIRKFKKKFPDLIKPYQNEKNLGIFGNIETTWSKAEGDVIWYLSGDDEYCHGIFEKANQLIYNNSINLINDNFTLYFDFERVHINGKRKTHKNNSILKYDPVSLKIRNLIYNRTVGIGYNVYKKFKSVNKNIGIMADGLIDIQVQLFSESNYYYPFVGSIYYTNIGIGSKTRPLDAIKSNIACIPEFLKLIHNLSNNDLIWFTFLNARYDFELDSTFKNYQLYLIQFFKTKSLKYGLYFFLKQFLFTIYHFSYIFRNSKS